MARRKIMLLGESAMYLLKFFVPSEIVYLSNDPVEVVHIERYRPTHIICFGYRHIIKKDVISSMSKHRIINLHPSYLPFGRGAHPNFWAWKNGEPHGVTIHAVDEGLDTGPIFARKKVEFTGDESLVTLESTYQALHVEMIRLFGLTFRDIFSGRLRAKKQDDGGSKHRTSELPRLPNGWQTTIDEVRKL
jgi:methionyl-tRNA formyltransferase